MLYVFHVDMGRMMKFDMTVALSSVEKLKDTIESLHGIPSPNIVLLVSGGEMLTQSTQVSFYSAGTDTNPIYMFSTGDFKQPSTLPAFDPDVDLKEQVDRCLTLPAVYDTVVTRAQLAQQMYELAREEEAICERLVHEQHLQQQGWSAVVANMEDLTDEFRQRFRNFCISFDKHLEKRNKYLELLQNFGDDLKKLSKIPILPGLMQLAEEDFHGFDELLDNDEGFLRSQQNVSVLIAQNSTTITKLKVPVESFIPQESHDDEKRENITPNKKIKMGDEEKLDTYSESSGSGGARRTLTLLQWISAKENNSTLNLMCEECVQGLGTFNDDVYEKLKSEVHQIIKLADQSDVKEIKGLGERLCKLEEFKYKIKHMVQDQKELSTAFQQNQNRAINLRDASILPDLCASHQSQLLVMLQNHQKIRDHRRCISKAKDELGANLHTRLQRIVVIENAMSEFDNRLLFYHRCLRRAERHINIIEQIHQAPSIYVAAVTEVVRRKIFSGEFRQWASRLAGDFESIHSEEIMRRNIFNSNFEGHFLNILFPGMNDMPPAFANENPLVFDAKLPNITKSDIDLLSLHLPDLTTHIQLPDMGPVITFFDSRSGNKETPSNEALRGVNKMPISENLHSQRVVDIQGQLKDGCESETDTEEFEKVIQPEVYYPVRHFGTSTSENIAKVVNTGTVTDVLQTNNVETLTEEVDSTHLEVERLKAVLRDMSEVSINCVKLGRADIETIKAEHMAYNQDLHLQLQNLTKKIYILQMQNESRELHIAQISDKYQTEILRLKAEIALLEKDVERLNGEKNNDVKVQLPEMMSNPVYECHCQEMKKEVEHFKNQLQETKNEKEKAIAEAREKLIHEHKSEIESLRCRFKLMKSMERSPSDTSLEKVEKPEMIEVACYESILAQTRNELLSEKENAIKKAIDIERAIWQSKILPINSEVIANISVLKEMLEEKEKQLNMFREKDVMLTKENFELKTRLNALTNEDGNSWLKEKIEYLNRDKNRLEEELILEKSRRSEMEASFAAIKCSTYEQNILTRSKASGSTNKYIMFDSCSKGDMVFVIWSMRHSQFMVLQDTQNLYFVHGDSLSSLNLRLPTSGESEANQIPIPFYAIGRVIDKEYCQARKNENRYRVLRGSKFYRIKLAPLARSESKWSNKRDRLESTLPKTPTSRSISQSEITEAGSCSNLAILLRPSLSVGPQDVIDIGGVVATLIKERTISVSSVTEEDDEPVSLHAEHCRYISVSEEEETNRSVITEQSTNFSSDIQRTSILSPTSDEVSSSTATNTIQISTARMSGSPPEATFKISESNSYFEKDADDSDEYRSLDTKESVDFSPYTKQ